MDAWRYGIYLLVFTFNISLVRCGHLFDIDVNTRRQFPYLRATMYYSLFLLLVVYLQGNKANSAAVFVFLTLIFLLYSSATS